MRAAQTAAAPAKGPAGARLQTAGSALYGGDGYGGDGAGPAGPVAVTRAAVTRAAPPGSSPAANPRSAAAIPAAPRPDAAGAAPGAASDDTTTGPAPPDLAPAGRSLPVDARASSAAAVLGLFLKTARATQLYPRHSKVRQEALQEFRTALIGHLGTHGETTLVVRQDAITAFGEEVYEEENRSKSLAWKLFGVGVRSVRFTPGLDDRQAEAVTDVLTACLAANATAEDIQTSVWERSFTHVAFEVSDEGFSAADGDALQEFMAGGAWDHGSARGARIESERAIAAAPPAPPAPDPAGAPARLAALIAADRARDLPAEMGSFLLARLDAGFAAELDAPLEEYFETLLASGEIARAAQMLSGLKGAAAAGGGDRAKALTHVVERIGKSKLAPALGGLLGALQDSDPQGMHMLLVAIGEPAVAPLCGLLGTDAHDKALTALRVLAPKHARAIAPFVGHPSPDVVRAAMSLLVLAKAPDLASALQPALSHGDVGVRREAIRAAIQAGGPKVVEHLLHALEDPVYEIRAVALDGLGAARDPRAVTPLLHRIGQRSFESASTYERREVFRTLGRIGTPEATAALARILATRPFFGREQADETRALAAAALAHVQNAGARAALERHAGDGSEKVRRVVQQALKSRSQT